MSYVQSNIRFIDKSHGFTAEEAEKLTQEQFDQLPLCEVMNLYNNHRHVYDRLTGKQTATETATTPQDTPQESDAERFAREFEKRVDEIITRAFHPNGVD